MKVSEIIKLLKRNGCILVRHGPKHDMWYSPITENEFTVPRHKGKEMPIKTVQSILKQAGIK